MSGFFQTVKGNKKLFWAYVPLILLYASSYFQRIGIPGTIFNELSCSYGFSAEAGKGIHPERRILTFETFSGKESAAKNLFL